AIGCRSIQFLAENLDARCAAPIARSEATRVFAAGTRASTSGPPGPTSSAEAGQHDRLEASLENNAARNYARPRRCRARGTFQGKRRNQRHRSQEACHPNRTAPLALENGCGSQKGDRSRKMEKQGFNSATTIESSGLSLMCVISQRNHVVPLEREIVERCGVTAPTGRVRLIGTNDVSGGVHLNASAAERPVDETHFEFNRRDRCQFPRRQKIYPARTDVPSDQRHGKVLWHFSHANQTQRQRQFRPRITATFAGYADGMRRDARKTPWPGFAREGDNIFGAFELTQRRNCGPRLFPFGSSPHKSPPRPASRWDPLLGLQI